MNSLALEDESGMFFKTPEISNLLLSVTIKTVKILSFIAVETSDLM
jgi:hypothetical protein